VALVEMFLCPPWMDLVPVQLQDVLYVLDSVAQCSLGEHDQPSLVIFKCAILRPVETGECLLTPVLGIPSSTLKLFSERIRSEKRASFAPDGHRSSMLHFVPDWLVSGDGDSYLQNCSDTQVGDTIDIFSHEFAPSFTDNLSNVLFCVILRQLIRRAYKLSSEDVLLSLFTDIENEAALSQQDAVRLARLRCTTGRLESFADTPVSAMICDVKLICL
jgi:hypothetical protein